jgi:hypothetical protein
MEHLSKGWIVAYNTGYYPWVSWYETYEEALKEYNGYNNNLMGDDIYLAEVKETNGPSSI